MADVLPMPVPAATSIPIHTPTGPAPAALPMPPQGMPPPMMPIPGQPFTVELPPLLREVMVQFPEVLKRLGTFEAKVLALETKPTVTVSSPTKLVAAFAYLAGFSTMAVLVWLWFYAAIIFRL